PALDPLRQLHRRIPQYLATAGALMASARTTGGRPGRRMKNEINVVPYIDVMLVLLVIFMVTAPLVAPGMIDLPSVGQTTAEVPLKPLEVQVAADGVLSVRDLQQGESELTPMPSTQLADFIRDRQQ